MNSKKFSLFGKWLKLPKNMDESKAICKMLCKHFKIPHITFDDKYKNFGPRYNQCACCKDDIDCGYFNTWNYDLLVFAVLHEIGHFMDAEYQRQIPESMEEPTDPNNRNGFVNEFSAWQFAIDNYNRTFKQNISIKQGRYMINCLSSYLPNYNTYDRSNDGVSESETSFWCPMRKKIVR